MAKSKAKNQVEMEREARERALVAEKEQVETMRRQLRMTPEERLQERQRMADASRAELEASAASVESEIQDGVLVPDNPHGYDLGNGLGTLPAMNPHHLASVPDHVIETMVDPANRARARAVRQLGLEREETRLEAERERLGERYVEAATGVGKPAR